MQLLPNNCRMGKMGVTPKNWKSSNANPNEEWMIFYRFYDDARKKDKFVRIKEGLNRCHTLKEKQEFVKDRMEKELRELQIKGWNPIIEDYSIGLAIESLPVNFTLNRSLNYAFEKFDGTKEFKRNLGLVKNYFLQIAANLHFDSLPLKDTDERHLLKILEQCGKEKNMWNNRMFNYWRAQLACLFKILKDEKIIQHNYFLLITKKKQTKPDRLIITKKERKMILESNDIPYTFRRYIIIFFHSGARSTELLQVKKEDVNLEEQRFKILMKKGRGGYIRDPRIIKTIALPFWEEVLNQAEKGQYLFSEGLQPGNVPIDPKQISRRWKVHVKNKLGIEADFYSLKHANADEVAELEDIETAKRLMGHKSKVITMNYYAMGEKERQRERLKALDNEF